MLKTILLIDDQPDMLFMLRRVLSDEFSVVEKTDGLSALNWLMNGNTVDLIISDLTMPSMNGFEFIRSIRNSPNHHATPIILVTAQSDIRLKIKAFEIGVNDYVIKPVHPNELLLRVKNIFNLLSHTFVTEPLP